MNISLGSQYTPADAKELAELVQSALAERTPLQITGGGTRQGVGHPFRQTAALSMRKLDRIVDYDPQELVLTVEAGTRIAEIDALLESRGQMLAFEPDVRAGSTIGGVVAAGFAGPRRISAGNVRDHLLGFSAVSGRGEVFVAGGRVVKNVTGYDLPKILCGSWGQLAVLTQMTLKVQPRPRATLTLQVSGVDVAQALSIMTRSLRSQAAISAAAYIPQGMGGDGSRTLLRLEGFAPSIDARVRALRAMLAEFDPKPLDAEPAASFWTQLRAGRPLSQPSDAEALWRICILSSAAATLAMRLRELQASYCLDWGGNLVLALVPVSVPANEVRHLAEAAGGHATLMSAPTHYRATTPALHPEAPGVAALTLRVKRAFDPGAILDPQRFEAHIP